MWLIISKLFHLPTELVYVCSLQCSANTAPANSQTTWTMRATFPEYVVALATIVGSVLFTVSFTTTSTFTN
jgi:hypothetical protein